MQACKVWDHWCECYHDPRMRDEAGWSTWEELCLTQHQLHTHLGVSLVLTQLLCADSALNSVSLVLTQHQLHTHLGVSRAEQPVGTEQCHQLGDIGIQGGTGAGTPDEQCVGELRGGVRVD